eukprot:g82713.t1
MFLSPHAHSKIKQMKLEDVQLKHFAVRSDQAARLQELLNSPASDTYLFKQTWKEIFEDWQTSTSAWTLMTAVATTIEDFRYITRFLVSSDTSQLFMEFRRIQKECAPVQEDATEESASMQASCASEPRHHEMSKTTEFAKQFPQAARNAPSTKYNSILDYLSSFMVSRQVLPSSRELSPEQVLSSKSGKIIKECASGSWDLIKEAQRNVACRPDLVESLIKNFRKANDVAETLSRGNAKVELTTAEAKKLKDKLSEAINSDEFQKLDLQGLERRIADMVAVGQYYKFDQVTKRVSKPSVSHFSVGDYQGYTPLEVSTATQDDTLTLTIRYDGDFDQLQRDGKLEGFAQAVTEKVQQITGVSLNAMESFKGVRVSKGSVEIMLAGREVPDNIRRYMLAFGESLVFSIGVSFLTFLIAFEIACVPGGPVIALVAGALAFLVHLFWEVYKAKYKEPSQ